MAKAVEKTAASGLVSPRQRVKQTTSNSHPDGLGAGIF